MPIGPGTFTQLPPNSTGPKLATGPTYTENAQVVQDEKVLLGEHYLAGYQAVGAATNTATANSHMLQLMAGASLKVYVRRITIYLGGTLGAAITIIDAQIFRLSTAGTGGGVITPAPLDPADAASGAAAMTLPTVKGTETTQVRRFSFIGHTTAPGGVEGSKIFDWDLNKTRGKALVIPAGVANGIAIKNITALATHTFHVIIEFDEIAY